MIIKVKCQADWTKIEGELLWVQTNEPDESVRVICLYKASQ